MKDDLLLLGLTFVVMPVVYAAVIVAFYWLGLI